VDITEALTWLDAHMNLERMRERPPLPSLDQMRSLSAMLGEPQHDLDAIHITGTNGKGSVARLATSLMVSAGVSVGTYTSPHLHVINERIALNGRSVDDAALVDVLAVVRRAESAAGCSPSWFEVVTAAAYRLFSDVAVEAAVVEVGIAGRWDATNVLDAQVAVATTVDVDHVEFLGADPLDAAAEKAGIVTPGGVLVLGVTDDALAQPFLDAGARTVLRAGWDWAVESQDLAVGGWRATIRTPLDQYVDVVLPFHGRHQVTNLAMALTAVEALLGTPLTPDVVAEAVATTTLPARLEVVGHQPLTIIDGAHNAQALAGLRQTLDEEFSYGRRLLVVGQIGREPKMLVDALAIGPGTDDLVVVTEPRSPRAVPADDLAAAVKAAGVGVAVAPNAATAMDMAADVAGVGDLVLVAGSLYLAAEAREHTGRLEV